MKAKILERTGNRVRDYVRFEAESSKEITKDDAMRAQTELGYHPAGYGFESFKVTRCPVLMRYKATWSCQACCN